MNPSCLATKVRSISLAGSSIVAANRKQSVPRRRPTRFRRRIRARWLGVACLIVIGLLYYRPVHSYLHARRDLAARTAEVSQLTAQKRALQEQLASTTNGATLVQAARRIGLVRPGERLFIVKDIVAWRRAQQR
jgi:cell division protein FtsB